VTARSRCHGHLFYSPVRGIDRLGLTRVLGGANDFEVWQAASRTLQFDEGLTGLDLVDEVCEPPVAPDATDLDLGNDPHAAHLNAVVRVRGRRRG
jgi:hypothetical protein